MKEIHLSVSGAAVTAKGEEPRSPGGRQESAGKGSADTANQDRALKEIHLAVFWNCCSVQDPLTISINILVFLAASLYFLSTTK